MALHVPKAPGLPMMAKEGARHLQGLEEVVFSNIEACDALAKTCRSTFGPTGMNKMVINHIGKLFVTNDAATILKELEIAHPAAKLLKLATEQQEQEAGDGTNLVLQMAASLLHNAEGLIKMGLSVTEIADGYELASKKALEILKTLIIGEVKDFRDHKQVAPLIRSAVMSKQYGNHTLLGDLISKACVDTLPAKAHFNVDNVRVCKILGAGVNSSSVMKGMVFRRECEGEVKSAQNCKVAVFSCPFDSLQTETKGTVLITSGQELKDFSRGEESQMEQHVKDLVDGGVGVVISGGKVGELALHYLNQNNIMVVRVASKWDIRRLCSALGATPLPRITKPTAEEAGHADNVYTKEIGETTVVVFEQSKTDGSISTIVLRGSTENIMNNVEYAIDDGVNTYKCLSKDAHYVAGAGSTEMEIALQLGKIADASTGLEQYALRRFAQSFEVVASSLAENFGHKATDVISQLYAAHQNGKKSEGFIISDESAKVEDAAISSDDKQPIYDLYLVKYWAIKFATQAATTVLRVDQIIMAKPAGGPKPKDNPNWDE